MTVRRSSVLAVVMVLGLSGMAGAKTVTITMDKMTFVPAKATANVGDTVVWINSDSQHQPHNVIARSKVFASKLLMAPGERFSWQAKQKGSHDYTCTLHPGMDGVLQVK